jgi:hypothetical protein
LYPPSLFSADTPGAEPVPEDLEGTLLPDRFRSDIAHLLGFGIVVNLETGLAEPVYLGCLPQHNCGNGTD